MKIGTRSVAWPSAVIDDWIEVAPVTAKLEAALAYASWGWHVLPVRANEKVPATTHGYIRTPPPIPSVSKLGGPPTPTST